MKRALRITLRVLGVIVLLFIGAWIFVWAYITYNKSGIIAKVKAGINKQVKGKVEIKDVSIDFFHNYPNISVKLSGVTIRDSLWDSHHHDFLKAEKIYVRMKLFSLFSGKPDIGKLIVENAQVYYYTDTSGRSNLVKADRKEEKSKGNAIPDMLFKNTRLIMDYPGRNKFHDIELIELKCKAEPGDSGTLLKINIDAIVHGLGFNTQKGSYLKEKSLKGNFDLQITKTREIRFDKAMLNIDKQYFLLSGRFITTSQQPTFSLDIQTEKINFRRAIALLTETTQKRFSSYDILDPIDINAHLTGPMAYRSIPFTNIGFTVKDAGIMTQAGKFNNCSFTGNFTNQADLSRPRMDDNSRITIKKFTGKWENIPLSAKAIEVSNLASPFLDCDLHSSFDLVGLNDLTGSSSIQFIKGKGDMDIIYKGSLVNNDTIPTIMDGSISLKDAEINYLPRNISFRNLQGKCVLKNKDLFIQQLQTNAGTTALNMNGSVKNLLGLIYKEPEKLTLEWNISTPSIDLVEFMAFLGKRSGNKGQRSAKSKLVNASNKIDRMLQNGTARLNIQAGKVKYKKFTATNVVTSLSLLQDEILLNNARLNHAGGSILLNGVLSDEGRSNIVKLRSTITNVDIPTLFTAFNNFGQDAITSKNMKGKLSAVVNLSTSLSDKAMINDKNLRSTVSFNVVNGELNDFEPLQKISATVFKKRDFSRVKFAELKDQLEINGSVINFNKMEITSNVFTMFVEGYYDTKKGTDMIINVPTRNLKKTAEDELVLNKGKVGLNVRLRAKTGDDGKLKINWVPFGKTGRGEK